MTERPKNLHTKQAGFSVVAIIALLVILAGVGCGGWYVFAANKKASAPTSKATVNQNDNATETQPMVQATDRYVAVKEWNVRFELPPELRGDITYVINHQAEERSGGPELVDLVSKKFSEGALRCAVVEDNQPRALIRLERLLDEWGVTMNDPAPFKRVGNATFYMHLPACAEAIEREGSEADKQLLAALKNAVTTLEQN